MSKRKTVPRAKRPRTQDERSTDTIGRLLSAAHQAFAQDGFANTSIDDVIRNAGVTRGALYHHFENKTELFRAVFEEQEKELTAAVAAAARKHHDAWTIFCAGCEAFLEACLDPATQRIILIDAPAVIGWSAMREIESRYALALLRQGLDTAMTEGKLAQRAVEPLAHMMLGALSESAMAIARATDPHSAMLRARTELKRLLKAIAAS